MLGGLSARTAMVPAALGLLFSASSALAWGLRAHAAIDRAALATLPEDGPTFLRGQADFIAAMAVLPDKWRSASEPFAKMEEDPNHTWYREQFAGIHPIPRSRDAFVLALAREQQRIKARDPERARKTNIRWAGTLPYAAMAAYGRIVAGMREWRAAHMAGQDTRFIEQALGFDVMRLGHYIGDGAQPMHVTIHHDGWVGANPKGYSRDPALHWAFENDFVDRMGLSEQDIVPRIGSVGHRSGDLFDAVLAYLDETGLSMERVYQLDKQGAFVGTGSPDAQKLIYDRTTAGATMLRDMIERAWLESATTPGAMAKPDDPANPRYDAQTGSAPAPRAD